jgi:hypothetical protein
MKAKYLSGPSLLLIAFLLSCSYKETIKTGEDFAYISFSGSLKGATATIDNEIAYNLDPFDGSKKDIRFEVKPGRHVLIIQKNGTIVVKRELMFGVGTVTEVSVP